MTSEVNETDQFPALTDTVWSTSSIGQRDLEPFILPPVGVTVEPENNLQMRKLSRLLLSPYGGSNSFVTPWTVAHPAPLCMASPRQEYWSGLLFPSPEDLPDPGIEPESPVSQADSLLLSHQGTP